MDDTVRADCNVVLERAEALYQETLRLQREAGNQRGIAGTLGNLGEVARFRGDYKRAEALYEEDLALYWTWRSLPH